MRRAVLSLCLVGAAAVGQPLPVPVQTELDGLAKKPPASRDAWVERAIELARLNVRNGGGPFGALVVRFKTGLGQIDWASGVLLGGGTNRVIATNDSTAHGEVVALRSAQRKHGWNLGPRPPGTVDVMFTSAQMCVQCWGAMFWSSLNGVVYAATAKETEQNTGFNEGPIPEDWVRRLRDAGIWAEQAPHPRRLEPFIEYKKTGGVIYNSSK